MCGRFVHYTVDETLTHQVATLLGGDTTPEEKLTTPAGLPAPRYNIAPTTAVAIVCPADAAGEPRTDGAANPDDGYAIVPARWGLVPSWAKDMNGPVLFNARGETVATKPSFRGAFRYRRCLVIMNGYYEWLNQDEPDKPKKQPFYTHLPVAGDDTAHDPATHYAPSPLMFAAGIYDTGQDTLSASIITVAAYDRIAWLHHRMPLFLDQATVHGWLHGDRDEAQAIIDNPPLGFYDQLLIEAVDTAVGNARNQGPQLIERLTLG